MKLARVAATWLLLATLPGYGSGTASWEMNTYADFMRGRFSGVSLTRDGRMVLAPRLQPIFSSDEPSIWSVAEGSDKALYVGTGHRGRLYRVDAKGVSSLLWTAPEPEIFAVATGPDGSIYAGTSPGGKVYRIVNGQADEYFAPGATYIWSMVVGSDRALYVGVGDNGRIYRVTGKGAGEVWFETGQSHVTALTVDRTGRVLAGTDPNGIIYRLEGKDKAFVLYDAEYPEIRTLITAPNGAVYAAAQGGSVAQRTNAAGSATPTTSQTAPVTAPTISVTVTDEGAAVQTPPELKPKQPDSTKPQQQQQTSTVLPGQTVYTAPTSTDLTGVDKSALFRIAPDNTVETLWTSKEENIYDVLVSSEQVLFSTDGNGRIYRMGSDRRVTLIAQTDEGETTRLLSSGNSIVAATGTMGKLYRLSESEAAEGSYESPVHDAGGVARWGQLNWRGERKGTGKLAFRTRSGNSARPDRTWSEWSVPLVEPRGANVSSPNARFIQWKAEFAGGTATSPIVSGVSLAYLPQNNPPVVQSLNVTSQIMPITTTAAKTAAQQAASGTYSITVTDTGEAGPSSLSGTPSQTLTRGYGQQIQIIWQADDPDGDKLAYSLYFRGEDESDWKLIRGNFSETMHTLEGDVLADGRYLFRLIASDKPSNAGDAARQAELVSAPVLFDATPPVVTSTEARRTGATAQISVRATDAASSLRRAEYSLDATAWIPVDSTDGVVDGREETFQLRLEGLTPGEHIVVVRAYDASNNVGLTKVILR